ncbi:hypothetical protein KQI61_05935 [Anaerocolumna aminovalerica]|uniref:hypothetical protein n=1 Tax=Anaerocolumna aminovalerica TaxID=1527 RepID=UPI001C0EE194|nr:hypothetical protein [Anaerocolumna aminovalerica]MBU5331730.1 hypothetical protein [Anaerocolumna aminovalerica]
MSNSRATKPENIIKQIEIAKSDNQNSYAEKLSTRLNYVINTICKRAWNEGYDFTVDDIDYLKECNSLLGISTPDTYEEGFSK